MAESPRPRATPRAAQKQPTRVGPLACGLGLLASALAVHGCTGDALVGAQDNTLTQDAAIGGAQLNIGGESAAGAPSVGGSGGSGIVTTLPPDFTPSNHGGYKLGPAIATGEAGAAGAQSEQTGAP